ncbi:MAG: Cache 3/Cache 2 fusion domain-containing protein, partial [Candidatus Competibacteraceae bacterium]|nr:Cache 3/Cache 2 fusion domain-containing protein [Candidatus Competibacteraceae bacterium]
GYYYVIDAKPGKDYGRFVLHPTQEGVNLLESGNDPVAETIKQALQKQRGVIRYSRIDAKAGETAPREKIVVFDFASSLDWVITGDAFVDEITYAANAKSRQLAWLGFFTVVVTSLFLYLAIRYLVSKPLRTAMEAAHRLAQGELQVSLHHQRTDEIGRLLEAVREIARNLTDMATQIRETATSMHSVIEEITENHQQLTHHAEEQASALAETASTLEQLTATVKQNADHAQQADSLAAGARAQAEQGGQVVGQAVTAMTEINTASGRVAEVIGVIDEIAFQTNLLALNAAVEAARAGEHGRGFAVVAGEVRKLAQRSAEAAKEIKTLIQDSVAKVAEGERFVNESGKTLNEIVLATQKVNSIVAEIASANRQQTIGIEQVSQAVAKVDGMVQQNVTLASQATASGEIVNTQAKELNELMKFFKIKS